MEHLDAFIARRGYKSAKTAYAAVRQRKLFVTKETAKTLKYYDDMKIPIPPIEAECMYDIMRKVLNIVSNKLTFRLKVDQSALHVEIFHPTSEFNYIPEIVEKLKEYGIVTEDVLTEYGNYIGIYEAPYKEKPLHRKIVIYG